MGMLEVTGILPLKFHDLKVQISVKKELGKSQRWLVWVAALAWKTKFSTKPGLSPEVLKSVTLL